MNFELTNKQRLTVRTIGGPLLSIIMLRGHARREPRKSLREIRPIREISIEIPVNLPDKLAETGRFRGFFEKKVDKSLPIKKMCLPLQPLSHPRVG